MRRYYGLLLLFMVLLGVTFALSQSKETAETSKGELDPAEYGAIALVAKAELVALGTRVVFPVCIRVTPHRTPPEDLLRYLRHKGLPVSNETACYPPKQYPRGLNISIPKITREPEGQLLLLVNTSDDTLGPDVHFAERLRFGSYRLESRSKGEWRILSYAKEAP